MKFIYKILTNPHFELVIGILLIMSGISGAFYEVNHNDAFIVQGHHGVVFLGVVILLKCFAVIVFGIICSDEAMANGKAKKSQYFFSILHKIVHHWVFDLILSLTLIITGASEIFEVLGHQKASEESITVWFLGIILLGIVRMIKVGTKMFTVFFRISNAVEKFEKDTGKIITFNDKIFNLIRQPHIELVMSLFIILFCILEEVLNIEQQGLSSHHGLFLFGVFHLLKIIPPLFESAEIWKDSVER